MKGEKAIPPTLKRREFPRQFFMIEVYEKEDNCGRLCVAEVNDVTLKVVIEVKGNSVLDSKRDTFELRSKEALDEFVELEVKRKGYKNTGGF